jgi:hypothetical protein
MPSFTIAFPLKPGTKHKLLAWHSGRRSQFGGHTIDDYRQLISLPPYSITRQTWYIQTSPAGGEILVVESEGLSLPGGRDLFVNAGGALETWCVAQLNAQKDGSPGAPANNCWVDTLQILPRP